MNKYQEEMRRALSRIVAFAHQADSKVENGDIAGAQARAVFVQKALSDFLEESIACPKTETGYVR